MQDDADDASPTYSSLLEGGGAEKLKFSGKSMELIYITSQVHLCNDSRHSSSSTVLNPTQRSKSKSKAITQRLERERERQEKEHTEIPFTLSNENLTDSKMENVGGAVKVGAGLKESKKGKKQLGGKKK